MELHKRYFALVALILPTFATMALADDFADAREKINQAKPNINYDTFCAEMNCLPGQRCTDRWFSGVQEA